MVKRSLAHEHEWWPENVDVDWDEDLFVTWHCDFVEITGSTTSERLDETFYEEGAKCAATKTAVYEVRIEYRGTPIEDAATALEASRAYEYVWDWHQDRVEEEGELLDPEGPMEHFSIAGDEVGLGEEYAIVFEQDKVTVEDDWA